METVILARSKSSGRKLFWKTELDVELLTTTMTTTTMTSFFIKWAITGLFFFYFRLFNTGDNMLTHFL